MTNLIPTLGLPNIQHPNDLHWTSGQIGAKDPARLKEAGLVSIVNLRPLAEFPDFDEAALAAAAGLSYEVLPIAGPADLTLANAKALDALVSRLGDAPTLFHCASGNRVGALFALRAAWLHKASPEEALAIGRSYGLTMMAPVVAKLLAEGPG